MALRTGGWVLAVAGALAAGAGALGIALTPESVVAVSATLDTRVLAIPPEVLALRGVESIEVTGPESMAVWAARPGDVTGWLEGRETVTLRGLASWEEVDLETASGFVGSAPGTDADLWRSSQVVDGPVTLVPSAIESGVAVVVESADDSRLTGVTLTVSREPGFGWVPLALKAGAGVLGLGLLLLAYVFLAQRPGRGSDDSPLAGSEPT